ncbi:1-acyl-sn-glycerol-3-phosphate acyltransferase [Acidocella sp. KAb 2-4]|uniref:lysophospholipid acyltransferase family protein n=1 Tax=Acidocella sp. KAb 2-4 TaxID=2885158 RepID=UPI001D06A5CD|nr:lysophospholipid acyltransferase family protein [Acidocella sp. KAb 2-4]MCB5945456.1 1-acyl-sn-glycerol-3-phosphate acyltransferase [Acidocella sp. KAb 2-4]
MRFLRLTAFQTVMLGTGALLSLWAACIGQFLPGGITRVAQFWARICLWALRAFCGIEVRAEGLEHLPTGGAIIAAQHQSALDILIWLTLLPRPAFVFKRELKRIPVFGWLLEPAGMISVNRGGGSAALREMVAGARRAAEAGRQVVIFPEGTRVAHGARGQLRQGIAALAHAVPAPLVPAGTDSGRHWGRNSFNKTPGIVHIWVHPALPRGLGRGALLGKLAEIYYGG